MSGMRDLRTASCCGAMKSAFDCIAQYLHAGSELAESPMLYSMLPQLRILGLCSADNLFSDS